MYIDVDIMEELHEDFLFKENVDINGSPVSKTKEEFPYEYDPYVIFKRKNYSSENVSFYSDRIEKDYSLKDQDKALKEIGLEHFGEEQKRFLWSNPVHVEKYLSVLMGRQIVVTAITEGANTVDGYLYWIVYIQ